jgi:hypothetical protein
LFNAKGICEVYDGIDIRTSGKQKLGDELPAFDETLRVGFDDHILFDGISAGGLQPGEIILCNLYHAQTTSSIRFHIFVITEIRNLNAHFLGCLQNGRPFLNFDANSIYFQGGHSDSSPV